MAIQANTATFGVQYVYDPNSHAFSNEKYRGCSSSYGSAQMTVSTSSETNTYGTTVQLPMPIQDGTTIRWNSAPSGGFVIDKWVNASTGETYTPDRNGGYTYDNSTNTGLVLSPMFRPSGVTFSNRITVKVSGAVSDNPYDVRISCLNGFYTYDLKAGAGGALFTTIFNTGTTNPITDYYKLSTHILPDGQEIKLIVRKIAGCSVTVKVNNNPIAPYEDTERLSGQQDSLSDELEEESIVNNGRGISSSDSGQDDPNVGDPNFLLYPITPSSGTTISVVYTSGAPEQVTINAVSDGNGSVSITADRQQGQQDQAYTQRQTIIVDEGTQVTLTASPKDSTYRFVNWTVNGTQVSDSPTYIFTATFDDHNGVTFVAHFEKIYHTITVKTNSTNMGTVYIEVDGASAGTTISSDQYPNTRAIYIVASPKPGHIFSKWEAVEILDSGVTSEVAVGGNSREEVSFSDNGNLEYKATFALEPPASTVNVTTMVLLNNGGTLEEIDPLFDTAKLETRYTNQSGAQSAVTATAGSPKQIQAKIVDNQITLTNTIKPSRNTIVTIGNHRYSYKPITNPYRYIEGRYSNTFSDWNTAQASWTHQVNQVIKTIFLAGIYERTETFSLTTPAWNNLGSVISEGVRIARFPSPEADGYYNSGALVTLTASVDADYSSDYMFDHWEIGGESAGTSSTLQVQMDGNKTVEAVFSQFFEVTAGPRDTGGTVSIDPSPGSGTGWPNGRILAGEQVTFTATQAAGYEISDWSLNSSPIQGMQGESEYVIERLDGPVRIEVEFVQSGHDINILNGDGGYVDVLKLDGANWISIGQVGNREDKTFSVSDGSYIKIHAYPSSGYILNTITKSENDVPSIIANDEIIQMTDDIAVTVTYSMVSWLSTLTTIMKVY